MNDNPTSQESGKVADVQLNDKKEKKQKVIIGYSATQRIGLVLGPVLFIIMLLLPVPEGMEVSAMRVAAITVLMAIWWITEAVPIPATSLLPILFYPFLGVAPVGEVTAQYANPTIYLFIGGFFVAVTMERWNLHRRIALYTIKLVGTSPAKMTLGFMVATGFISMWVSNTATAMMMVPIGLAVIAQVTGISSKQLLDGSVGEKEQNFGKGLMLAIAYAASIGGIATIIGTPPNTIMVGMLNTTYGQTISFAEWMMLGLPLVIIMLAITWVLIVKFLFKTKDLKLADGEKVIDDEIKKMGKIKKEEQIVLAVFILVGLLWVFNPVIVDAIPALKGKLNDTVIAMFGTMLLFVIPANWKTGEFILDWKTAVKIPWDIVLLFGGGFAVASGFEKSGLAKYIAQQLNGLEGLHMLVFITIVTLLVVFLTEITSNTATATLLVPIMGASAVALGIHPYATIVPACVAASFAFMLPVATPPNAVVFGSGAVRIKDMAKAGLWLNLLGTVIIVIFIYYFMPLLWGIDLNTTPDWALNTAASVAK